MNSAFLEYLITGDKPSTKDSIYFEALFYDKIPPLTGIFSRSKNIQFRQVSLSAAKDALTLISEGNPEMDFKWDNIFGASINSIPASTYPSLPPNTSKELHILTIHFFAKRDELKPGQREEFDREFYAFDYDAASQWKNFILQMANNPKFAPADYKDLKEVPAFKRLLLTFINPNAGQKKGVQVWEKAKQFLQKSGCTFIEMFTTAPRHAHDYLIQEKLSTLKELDGIVTVSGDGIPHEVINGIFGRPDWEQLKDIPIGALLGGSACALACNQLARANEQLNLASACYLVAKGKTIKSDITCYEGLKDTKVYSFLSFVYGNMARIDIESERFRYLGNMRFYAYGVYAIARLRTDRAKITYNTKSSQLPPLEEDVKGDDWKEVDESFCYLVIQNLAHLDPSSIGAPLAKFDDGYNHLLYVCGEKNKRMSMVNILTKLEGKLFEGEQPAESTGLSFQRVKAFRFEPLSGGYYSVDGERYDAKKIQGSVMEKVLTVYCTK